MVNNNQIPIEVNKKPFETVYELKNEIPSFEEFMKDYKTDENLNYDDLSGGSVGEVKGYGPCYTSNPDCTHFAYESPPWVQLYLPCPATGCENRKTYSWIHHNCDYPIYISTDLDLKCVKCNNPSSMLRWKFNCYSYKHPGSEFEGTTYDDFFNALSFVNNVRKRTQRVQDIVRIISNKAW